jgi:hypothetical protein
VAAPTHHASHRALLRPAWLSWRRRAALDAIIVPSAREAGAVLHAGRIARELDSALIVLASRSAKSADIHDQLAPLKLKRLYVVDVPADLGERLPAFHTSKILAREAMARTTDVSAKRNVGLAVARMAGLRRVLFLDDDMRIPRPADLKVAAGLLRKHDAVGLRLGGFPDNSVVCHANRETGGFQDTFVGGGALVVATDRVTSFFPDVYNEDWFFLLDESRIRPVTVTGRAEQKPYDPFASVERARMEEFGDVLAEGVFGLLDEEKSIEDADRRYWAGFIRQRRSMIDRMIHRAHNGRKAGADKGKMIRSLRAARAQLTERVSAGLCVEYLRAWQHDLVEWTTFCEDLDHDVSVEKALGHFGLECAQPVMVPAASSAAAEPTSRGRLWPALLPVATALMSLAGIARPAAQEATDR